MNQHLLSWLWPCLTCVGLVTELGDAASFWAAAQKPATKQCTCAKCECYHCHCESGKPCNCVRCTLPPVIPPKQEAPIAEPARLELTVPFDAQVWIDDHLTQKLGTFRSFASPPINFTGEYKIKVVAQGREWNETVKVHPGKTSKLEIGNPRQYYINQGMREFRELDASQSSISFQNCGPTG